MCVRGKRRHERYRRKYPGLEPFTDPSSRFQRMMLERFVEMVWILRSTNRCWQCKTLWSVRLITKVGATLFVLTPSKWKEHEIPKRSVILPIRVCLREQSSGSELALQPPAPTDLQLVDSQIIMRHLRTRERDSLMRNSVPIP